MSRWASSLCGLCALAACDAPLVIGTLDGGGQGAPRLLYIDQIAGPTHGGENGDGTYLSLFGFGFGAPTDLGTRTRVRIGGAEVATYEFSGVSLGRADVQQLTVQLGSLGNAAAGSALPVVVEVDGVASVESLTFTVQPGRIWFVDAALGDDATATADDITQPFLNLQTPTGGGALGSATAGDVIVFRAGLFDVVGMDNRWARFKVPSGSAPTGASGTGYVSLIAYPKEEVRYRPPTGAAGGLHGTDTGGTGPSFIVISGLHLEGGDATVTDAPINLQEGGDSWRVVNNEVGPWAGSALAAEAGITGDGTDDEILGNSVHDISGGQNNGIGLDDRAATTEVAWNEVDDCPSKDGIHFFSGSSATLSALTVHHNHVARVGQHALLIGSHVLSSHIYDNVFESAGQSALLISLTSDTVDHLFEHNTVVGPCEATSVAMIENVAGPFQGTVAVQQNVFAHAETSLCTAGFQDTGNGAGITFTDNLWSGLSAPPGETNGLSATVVFADGGSYALAAGSPGVDRGAPGMVVDDFDAVPRDSTPDLGAFEYAATTAGLGLALPPSNLQVSCASADGSSNVAFALMVSGCARRRNRKQLRRR